MSSSTISDLFETLTSPYRPEPDFILDFHQRNSLFFNNYNSFKDNGDLQMYMEMTGMFIDSLCRKGRFNGAIDEANKSLERFDKAIGLLGLEHLKSNYQWYNEIVFLKAVASYRLRDYKTARMLFKSLAAADPENENLKMWISNVTYYSYHHAFTTINIICSGVIFFAILFRSSIEPPVLRVILPALSLAGVFLITLYRQSLRRNLRQSEKSEPDSDK